MSVYSHDSRVFLYEDGTADIPGWGLRVEPAEGGEGFVLRSIGWSDHAWYAARVHVPEVFDGLDNAVRYAIGAPQ